MQYWTFTGETKEWNGFTLHQIKRISDNKIGGWIDDTSTLSQDGSWIDDTSHVFNNSNVTNNSTVTNNSNVINSNVTNSSYVINSNVINSYVINNSTVTNNSYVTKSPLTAKLHKHQITITDDKVIIGCQSLTWDEWEKQGQQIGLDNGYSQTDIDIYTITIKTLLLAHQQQ